MDTSLLSYDGWYSVQIDKKDVDAATEWCLSHCGDRWSIGYNKKGTWRCYWTGKVSRTKYKFEFRNEIDAIHFILRWV